MRGWHCCSYCYYCILCRLFSSFTTHTKKWKIKCMRENGPNVVLCATNYTHTHSFAFVWSWELILVFYKWFRSIAHRVYLCACVCVWASLWELFAMHCLRRVLPMRELLRFVCGRLILLYASLRWRTKNLCYLERTSIENGWKGNMCAAEAMERGIVPFALHTQYTRDYAHMDVFTSLCIHARRCGFLLWNDHC